MELEKEQFLRVAGFELNALHLAKALPRSLEGVKIDDPGTLIYDTTGEPLYRRVPLERRDRVLGHADVAVRDAFAEPLLSVGLDTPWNEAAMVRRAQVALRKQNPRAEFDKVRFVVYSYPKLAAQFLHDGKEVAMLELMSWVPVPPARKRDEEEGPSNFERWSLIEETPERERRENAESFEKRIGLWGSGRLADVDSTLISVATLEAVGAELLRSITREVHYAPRTGDHHICYELRSQQTHTWCVAASVEMVLNFYRWRYDQPRIATELDIGTCAAPSPIGLPYGQEIKVVHTIEGLSSHTLDATMVANPGWAVYRDEIDAHRPVISFIPGHSRTVAGYTEARIALSGELPYRGLLVYDPGPATDCDHPEVGGSITRWENFRTTTYRYAFTAELQHI